ncbi:MAG TPA: tail fiber domain-containing protein [Verrucomicrobiota bacterium]|nr:tail fiber domain-containing protein [Verrucomicrobiota bacterium]
MKNGCKFPLTVTLLALGFSVGYTQKAAAQAQVFETDVVIHNSLAVGVDAAGSENFGFDTIRLKENNLRIHFDDTSTGTFPANDWRIVVNDTANSGPNYFSIEDSTAGVVPFTIRAGARANALYVDPNGRVGLGTSSPVLELHVVDGDTAGLRLEQNNSSGYTAQSWDIAGNESNFFVRDVTSGSKLPFKIRPNSPTGALVVDVHGVGIGIAGADLPDNSATLHVNGTAFITQTLEIGSSRETKENIREVTLEEARSALNDLNPVRFNYKTDDEQQLGFIAEDVPDLVATQSRKSVVPMDFVAILTKVVQDHERREGELRETIRSQQALLESLAARLAAVETHTGVSRNDQ